MKKHMINMHETQEHQRFGFRKLSIGLVSALLGTSIYFISSNAQVAKADTIPDEPQKAEVDNKIDNSIEKSNIVLTDTAIDKTSNGSSGTNVADTTSNGSSGTNVTDTTSNSSSGTNVTDTTSNSSSGTNAIDTTSNGSSGTNATDTTSNSSSGTNATDTTSNSSSGTNATDTTSNDGSKTNVAKKKQLAGRSLTRAGVAYTYDELTDTLTIDDAVTLTTNDPLFGLYDQYGTRVKHIKLTKKVTLQDAGGAELFKNCTSLLDITGIENIDTSAATNLQSMFDGCSKLTSLDLRTFNTSKVGNMVSMFQDCSSLTNLNVTSFDTSQISDMMDMFDNCSSLTELDVSKFDTSNVRTFDGMFMQCKNLQSLDVSKFNTSSGYAFDSMFADCKKLKQLDVANFDMRNAIMLQSMFAGCDSLISLDLSKWQFTRIIPGSSTSGFLIGCTRLRILKLGSFSIADSHLNNGGLWFKQGTGTLTDPEDKTGKQSEDFIAAYNPKTDADTYIRGTKYNIQFVDKDNNDQEIATEVLIPIYLTNYSDTTDFVAVGDDSTQLLVYPTQEVTDTIKKLEAANYKVATNPFNPAYAPSNAFAYVPIEFAHKIDTKTETVNRTATVFYQDTNGTGLKVPHLDLGTFTFTRTSTTDLVTGKTTWTDWSVNQQTKAVKNPVIKGYVTDKAELEPQTVSYDKDLNIFVTYKQLGSYIPVDKDGNAIPGTSKVQYENDETDPTKIKTDFPTIDGYVPSKDAKTPTDVTKDTKVPYLEANKTTISFVDTDNSNQPIAGIDSITTSAEIGKAVEKPANIDMILADLANKGYELVSDPFKDPVIATEGKQNINYTFKHKLDSNQTDTVTRKQTIHFVDSDGKSLADDKVTEVKFTRSGVKDLVTGKIIWDAWSKEQTLPEVKAPVIKGYVADKATITSQNITADKDVEATVTYQKLGSYIPVDKDGNAIKGIDKIPYENDDTDPTKIKPNLPTIDGYVPSKDAKVPSDPTKDTKIPYLENNKTTISFIDKDNDNQPINGIDNIVTSTEIGKAIDKPANIDTILADLANKGYELVADPFKDPVMATDGKQNINYVFKHKLDDSQTDTVTRKQTIHFVDSDGKSLTDDKITEVKFTRTGVKDIVTGKITWNAWSKAQTLPEVKVPVIKGYVADKATIASQEITADKDIETTVTYQKLGSYIPVDKNGNTIAGQTKIPYENDETDPTKIKPDLPVIDGYVPSKDAKTPTDVTKDTKVPYLETNKTTISFIDKDNNNQAISGIDSITSSTEIGKNIDKPANIDKIIKDLADKGYELVTDPFKDSVTATDGKQNINYVFKHKLDDSQTDTVTRNQTIHFVDNNGKSLAADKVTEVKFTRTGVKDLVTGKVTWNAWSKDQTLPEVKVPVIKGYITDKATIDSQEITADKDIEATVTYQKLGNYLPVDKDGNAIKGNEKIPYENDATDPTKIKPNVPTIDGYVPSKDAKTPTDPTKDTKVPYLEVNKTTISFIDKDNNNQAISGIDSITSSTEIGKTIEKPANIDKIIKDLADKGYELVSDPFKNPVTATDGKQNIDYVFKHKLDNSQTDTVTRKQTVHFVDSNGKSLAADKVTEVKFTRTGVKDLVTGKITWSDWSKDQTLPEVKVPVIKGYVADKAIIDSQTITSDKDIETTVTYQKLGNYLPVDKNGNAIKGKEKIPYENDPTDPTKIKPDLPTIDGYVPSKDAKTPTDVTKDTQITYLESNKITISFIDKDNDNQAISGIDSITTSAEIGKTIDKPANIDKIIKDLADKGYELVSDPFKNPIIATDGQQSINYVFKHKLDNNQTDTTIRKQTIHFVDNDGKSLADDKVTEVKFTRTGVKDLVTGKVTWSDWSKDQTLPEVKVPVIKGYVSDKATVASQTITSDKDIEATVTYQKLGSYLPVDKDGNVIKGKEKIPYENDATDPTKIKTGLPTIDGYVPSKDAKVPTDPTKDTQVTYLESNKTTISFIDKDNNNQPIAGIDSITSSTEIGKTIEKPANIDKIIKDLADKGYELVSDPFKDAITATDGEQKINYVFKHKSDDTQTETVTRKQTVHFVDSNGKSVADDKVTEVKFTRTGIKDLVTGKIVWSDWSKAQTLPEVKVPVIKGYIANKATIASQNITVDKDIEATVTYQKLGSYVPVDKDGNVIKGADKIPYENDPDDPTKIKTDQKLPTIDGHKTPNAPVPSDPTKDTNVTYDTVKTKFQVIVHDDTIKNDLTDYHWEDANAQAGDKVAYDWAKVKKDLLAHGYEIVQEPNIPDIYGSEAQTITIHVKHKVVSLDPDNPPTADSTVNDSGTKWPDKNEYNRTYEHRIQFVDEQGKTIAPDQVQKVRFSRKLTVDAVTGKILNPDASWTPADKNYQAVKIPSIAGYESSAQSKNGIKIANGLYPSIPVTSENKVDTIVYKKVNNNSGNSGTNVTPTKPTPDDVSDEPKEPTKPVTPDKPITPNKPDTKPHKKPTVTNKPTHKATTTGGKIQNQALVNNKAKSAIIGTNTVKAATLNDTTLPQTGNKQTDDQKDKIALIVLACALIGLGFGVKPKKYSE